MDDAVKEPLAEEGGKMDNTAGLFPSRRQQHPETRPPEARLFTAPRRASPRHRHPPARSNCSGRSGRSSALNTTAGKSMLSRKECKAQGQRGQVEKELHWAHIWGTLVDGPDLRIKKEVPTMEDHGDLITERPEVSPRAIHPLQDSLTRSPEARLRV